MTNRFLSMFLVTMLLLSISPIIGGAEGNIGNVTDTQGNSTLIWGVPSEVVYGTNIANIFNAIVVDNENTIIPGTDGVITYTQLNGTVNESVTASTIFGVGVHTLYAVFSPTNTGIINGRQICTVSATMNVVKDTPIIDWATPADIMAGTPINEVQLNAIARDINNNSIPGNYTYSPLNGTVLAAGNTQSLTVNFIPNDQINYNNATKTVYINIKADKTMVAEFAGEPVNGSSPLTVLFNDKSTGSPTSRLWLFGDGGYSVTPGISINHTYAKDGIYDVTLFVFNETTFSQVQKMDYINVGNIPANSTNNDTPIGGIISTNSSKWLVINDIWADPSSGSAPFGTTFHCDVKSAHSAQPVQYNWTFEPAGDDYYSKSGPDASHTYKKDGVYNVTLNVRDKCGNTASFTRLAYIVVLPATANGDDRVESDSGSNGGSSSHKKPQTSTITVTNNNVKNNAEFCWWSAGLQSGTTVKFITNNKNAKCVSWYFGDGTTASGRVVEHTYANVGTYKVSWVTKSAKDQNLAVTKLVTIS